MNFIMFFKYNLFTCQGLIFGINIISLMCISLFYILVSMCFPAQKSLQTFIALKFQSYVYSCLLLLLPCIYNDVLGLVNTTSLQAQYWPAYFQGKNYNNNDINLIVKTLMWRTNLRLKHLFPKLAKCWPSSELAASL